MRWQFGRVFNEIFYLFGLSIVNATYSCVILILPMLIHINTIGTYRITAECFDSAIDFTDYLCTVQCIA